jgi:hypothetical protein
MMVTGGHGGDVGVQKCKGEKGMKRGTGNRDVGRRPKAASRVGGCGLGEVSPLCGGANFPFPGSPFRLYAVGSGLRPDIGVVKGRGG